MKWIDTVSEMMELRPTLADSVALVPTMGYLHEGHLSLVRRAKQENDHTIVSIFVNPAQFGQNEDLATYPRDIERDKGLLRAEGVDIVFAPDAGSMYPPGFSTYVTVEGLSDRLEGEIRPGHFRGVATVVTKLFTVVQPHFAYFGQKDAQQLAIIRRLSTDLNLGVRVVPCPIVREPDGLAMSSRNSYLMPEERRAAVVLHHALEAAKRMWEDGERRSQALEDAMMAVFNAEPLAKPDYAVVVDPDTFEQIEQVNGPALLAVAARIGRTRLIDNMTLE